MKSYLTKGGRLAQKLIRMLKAAEKKKGKIT